MREPLLAFAAAIGLASALYWVGHGVPFVHQYLSALIAVVFFYTPAVAARIARHPFDYRDAGLRFDPVGLGARVYGVAVLVTFPLFLAGFFGFYGVVCGGLDARLGVLCPGAWRGFGGGHLRLPDEFLLRVLSQIVVVALPEELFFRGYLMQRLEARWPPGRRLAGAPVGVALLVSSALFALGHVMVDLNPQRLAVFVPGLIFGWMRARTGSIAAGVGYHASCNLLSDVLHTIYF